MVTWQEKVAKKGKNRQVKSITKNTSRLVGLKSILQSILCAENSFFHSCNFQMGVHVWFGLWCSWCKCYATKQGYIVANDVSTIVQTLF